MAVEALGFGTMTRSFEDANGLQWDVEVISDGTTSAYLNPRVHRPILQFTPTGRVGARRYVALKKGQPDALDELTEEHLLTLFAKARTS